MKKCPNCQKEFPDTMRFCQTDGTPLVEAAPESQPEDPLKTTVVRQEDIASAIPPSDPFKTMVAGSSGSSSGTDDDGDDLLQLPQEEFDPMKTMVVAPLSKEKPVLEEPKPEPPRFDAIKEEIKPEAPSSPYSGGFSQPSEPLPEAPQDYSDDPTLFQPEPPKFNEPAPPPPNFSGMSANEEEDLPQTVMSNSWDNAPKSDQSPYANDSPFSKPSEEPMSSPFDLSKSPYDEPPPKQDAPPSSSNQPSSPFNAPPSSFDAPPEASFNQPPSAFDNQPSSFDQPKTSFDEQPNQFGAAQSQFDQMNQGFGDPNRQMQQSDWTPPPSPEQGWGEQGLGANTPFQPPVVGAGQSKTLAIISLVLGGIGLISLLPSLLIWLCSVIPILFGLGAIITGFLGRSRANRDPDQFGGAGLAMGGIATGALALLGSIGIVLMTLLWMGYVFSR